MNKYDLHIIQLISTCSNCYILVDKKSKTGAIIDPGCNAEQIMKEFRKSKATGAVIINTHGHWDHIGANRSIQKLTEAPILIHKLDEPMLTDSELNLAPFFLGDGNGGKAKRLLQENDIIELGDLRIKVIHTPGHTPGGICLMTEDLLFTGDTLFHLSVGRSDLGAGDHLLLLKSLKEKLFPLPDQLKILPGHGESTTLGYEKKHNPFFNI